MGLIRYVLAAAVVMTHSEYILGYQLMPGNLAVEMFFMISGFYMSLILNGKYEVRDWSGRKSFYLSRFFRLWPTFIVTTIAINLLWIAARVYLGREPTSAGDFRGLVNAPAYITLQFSNLFMIGQDLPSLFHVSASKGIQFTLGPGETLKDGSLWLGYVREIGQAWSIGTEIWFYLLAPFLVRLKSFWLISGAVLSLALRCYLDTQGFVVYFFFPTQVALFLIGMLAQRECRADWLLGWRIACLGILVVLAGVIAFGQVGHLDERFKWGMYALFALTLPAIFRLTKGSRIDRIIGELSYPIYITHTFILSILVLGAKRLGIPVAGEVLLAVTTVVSLAIYFLIDMPLGRWRQRFARNRSSAELQEPSIAHRPVAP